MKHFFLKQTQAFISHKRMNGQASPEAILTLIPQHYNLTLFISS